MKKTEHQITPSVLRAILAKCNPASLRGGSIELELMPEEAEVLLAAFEAGAFDRFGAVKAEFAGQVFSRHGIRRRPSREIDVERLPERMMQGEELAFREFADYFGSRFPFFFVKRGVPGSEAEEFAPTCVRDIAIAVLQ